jgi:DNA-binding NarL/FixJ family response regulator
MIVADPLAVVAAGLQHWLQDHPRYHVAAHATTGGALLERLRIEPFDLVIMEVSLPQLDGIDTMRAIRKHHPDQKVLAFSDLLEIEYINSMLVEGAMGYLSKTCGPEELRYALSEVLSNRRYLSDNALKVVERGYAHTTKHPDGEYIGLTQREREIIRMVAQERTNEEIALALFISVDTVKSHRRQLMTKLNVRNSAGLVRYAVGRRWV